MAEPIKELQRDRLANAVLYFASRVKSAYKVKIFKLLFFLDFWHFKETGLPVTDLDYFAWDFGPVPKKVFEDIEREGVPAYLSGKVAILPNVREEDGIVSYQFRPVSKAKFNDSSFTPRQLEIMENLVFMFRDVAGNLMSEITHLKNSPWDITKKGKGLYQKIDYLLAIDDESPLSKEEAQEIFVEHQEFQNNFHAT